MEAKPRKVVHYLEENDKDPFAAWLAGVEGKLFAIVTIRLKRVEKGLFGDMHSVGEGVSELVIDFGPGYRVYFGQDGDTVVLLLGGSKKTQAKDITKSKLFWKDYNDA